MNKITRKVEDEIRNCLQRNFSNLTALRNSRTNVTDDYDSRSYRLSLESVKKKYEKIRNQKYTYYRFPIYKYTRWFYPDSDEVKIAEKKSLSEIEQILDNNDVEYEEIGFNSYTINPTERSEGQQYVEYFEIQMLRPSSVDTTNAKQILQPIIDFVETNYDGEFEKDYWSNSGRSYDLGFNRIENTSDFNSSVKKKIRDELKEQFGITTKISTYPNRFYISIVDPITTLGLTYNEFLVD